MLSRRMMLTLASATTGLLMSNTEVFASEAAEDAAEDEADDIIDDLGDEAGESTSTEPLELTDDTVVSELNKLTDRPLFVMFHAPWCGHCKRMMPAWEELAAEQSNKGSGCLVGRVDATVQRKLADHFAVRGFPTIKMLTSTKVYDYEGGRSQDDLLKYCNGDDWKNPNNGMSLPWNQGAFEKAQKLVGEYIEKAGQVHSFEPSLLPVTFLWGLFVGGIITMCFNWTRSSSKNKKEELTTDKKEEDKKTTTEESKSKAEKKKE